MDAVTQFGNAATAWITQSASHATLLLENFLILVVLFIVMLGFSYKAGRGGIISLILAFYAGYAIYILFPFTKDIVGAGGTKVLKAVLSIVIYGIATFLPFHFIQRLITGGYGVLSFFQRVGLSFLAAAFLLALAYHVFHVSNIYSFPQPLNMLFEPDQYFFWWFIAPMIGLLFLVH